MRMTNKQRMLFIFKHIIPRDIPREILFERLKTGSIKSIKSLQPDKDYSYECEV